MPHVRVLVCSLAVAIASGLGQPYYWSGKNGDALRTGASPYSAPFDLSAGPNWSYILPGNRIVRSHPLIDDQLNIYLAVVGNGLSAGQGEIIKFSASGKKLWNYTAPAAIPNGPAMHDGLLVFLTASGYVHALDMETGSERWSLQIGDAGPTDTHSMAAAEGYVIAPVHKNVPELIPFPIEVSDPPENQLVAMDMSGEEVWRFQTDAVMYNSLASIVDGSVVIADTNGRTYRLDLATGHLLWKKESADYRNFTGMTTGGAVVGPNRVVYVSSNVGDPDTQNGSGHGRLSAYALETGQLLWRQDVEMYSNNGAAVGPIGPDGEGPLAVVVIVGHNPDLPPQKAGIKRGMALAFDAETGERLAWQHELIWDHLAAAGDTLEHICLPDLASNPAIGGDGTVYFGFEDGRVYALRDADGDGRLSAGEVSFFDGGNAYQGSPGIAPGMLVSCPCNGLHVFTSPPAPSFNHPSCQNGNHGWPRFNDSQSLNASPWGQYFTSVYGSVPSAGYPICVFDFWYLYQDKLDAAHVDINSTDKGIVGQCPSQEGDHFSGVGGYAFVPGASWIYHPFPYTAYPSNAWVEVNHQSITAESVKVGMWFVNAIGSGLWINLGATKAYDQHIGVFNEFTECHVDEVDGKNDTFPSICTCLRANSVQSVQFLHHDPCAPCSFLPDVFIYCENMEIVMCELDGSTTCGGKPDAFRAGWMASEPCECEEMGLLEQTNCRNTQIAPR